jgi:hypothetical protein
MAKPVLEGASVSLFWVRQVSWRPAVEELPSIVLDAERLHVWLSQSVGLHHKGQASGCRFTGFRELR